MSHWRHGSDMDHRTWLEGKDRRRPQPSRDSPAPRPFPPSGPVITNRDLGDEDDGYLCQQIARLDDISASLDRESDRELRALRAEGYLR